MTLSKNELSQIITEALRRRTGRDDCTITVAYGLTEPDLDGCNWSGIWLRSGGADPELVATARQCIEAARRKYPLIA